MAAKWIWYPADFEIYHGMKQNFQREERGYGWPAYWKMDDWNKNVSLGREYDLASPTTFCVYAKGDGYVLVDSKKYAFEKELHLDAGHHEVKVFVGKMDGLPCVYVEGDVIFSDETWLADNFDKENILPVGTCNLYTKKEQDPNEVYYEEIICQPVKTTVVNGGTLVDFGRMITGILQLELTDPSAEATVCFGESDTEALDVEWCYYKQESIKNTTPIRKRAFRYIFLPDTAPEAFTCSARHQFVPIQVKSSFHCDNERINRIWEVSEETFRLCSGLFYIDGVKRDRWIWSGDAYQSYFVNPYLFFDEDIDKRTMLALRGNLKIDQHLNTIVDYSLLWIIAIEREYMMTGNVGLIRELYPKMEAMMDLVRSQLDEHGFIYGREKDWIFIDWTEMDKNGVISGEQMLLLKAYQTMAVCAKLIGEDAAWYEQAFDALKQNVMDFFWSEEKGAFIDSFSSGKNNVTRHSNIFAILFDLVDEQKQQSIVENVLFNDDIVQITTPYFKFFELDVLCKLGYLDQVWETIHSYWGGMLDLDAVTFWEEYDPTLSGSAHYAMYGDPFGKSLCHAWAASPIYLLGRYYLGLYPTAPGYESFCVEPKLSYFKELDCTFPIKGGNVHILYNEKGITVTADKAGGTLVLDGKETAIPVK